MRLVRKLFFLLCIAAGTGLLTLFVLDYLVMPNLVNVDKVRVPELREFTPAKAQKKLQKRRLRLAVRDSLYQESIPAGSIVDQAPDAGKQIKQGRRVFVDISKGVHLYPVPEIKRVSLREARLQLESSQLQIGSVGYISSADFPEGTIVEQLPRPGVSLVRNSRVDLKISSGPPSAPKRIPDLVGLPIEVVEDTLKKYEMRLGAIQNRIDNLRPPGIVLSQKPTPTERVRSGTPIDLVLSVQETLVAEPDIRLEKTPEDFIED
jgi:beta-lactam-binding protein with PASTA domain